MNLTEIKEALNKIEHIDFILPDGARVPSHFHVTEFGQIDKQFIDCGGVLRNESVISFQLYTANDYNHRIAASKLRHIVELSESKLNLQNLPIEVEYQGETIGKYGLEFENGQFHLTTKFTDCLAKDNCGIPKEKKKLSLADINGEARCEPGSGCC